VRRVFRLSYFGALGGATKDSAPPPYPYDSTSSCINYPMVVCLQTNITHRTNPGKFLEKVRILPSNRGIQRMTMFRHSSPSSRRIKYANLVAHFLGELVAWRSLWVVETISSQEVLAISEKLVRLSVNNLLHTGIPHWWVKQFDEYLHKVFKDAIVREGDASRFSKSSVEVQKDALACIMAEAEKQTSR
jgi:hypothetical protein